MIKRKDVMPVPEFEIDEDEAGSPCKGILEALGGMTAGEWADWQRRLIASLRHYAGTPVDRGEEFPGIMTLDDLLRPESGTKSACGIRGRWRYVSRSRSGRGWEAFLPRTFASGPWRRDEFRTDQEAANALLEEILRRRAERKKAGTGP